MIKTHLISGQVVNHYTFVHSVKLEEAVLLPQHTTWLIVTF